MNFVSNLIFKINTNVITDFLYLHIEINITRMWTMCVLCGCRRFIINGKKRQFDTTEDFKRASRFEGTRRRLELLVKFVIKRKSASLVRWTLSQMKTPPSPTRRRKCSKLPVLNTFNFFIFLVVLPEYVIEDSDSNEWCLCQYIKKKSVLWKFLIAKTNCLQLCP